MINDVEKYSSGLVTNAKKYLKQSLDENSGKALHKLRVEIKKIHALLHLFSDCSGYNNKQDKKFKKLFKRSGKIRDLQLLIHHLERNVKPKSINLIDLLENLKQQNKERFKRFRHRYRHREDEVFEKTSQLIRDCVLQKPQKDSSLYFKRMKEKISSGVYLLSPSQKQIHLLRKDIKTLKYNLALSHKVEAENLMDEKLLGKWEELLGEWHDTVQIARRLAKIKTEVNPELRNELNCIRKVYIRRGKLLLKNFLASSRKALK